MYSFDVLIGGVPHTGGQGWFHIPSAEQTLTDAFHTRKSVEEANKAPEPQPGFAGAVALSSPGQAAMALSLARTAQPSWATVPLTQRLAIVSRLHQSLLRDYDDLVALLVAEGQPLTIAKWNADCVLSQFSPETVAHASADLLSRRVSRGRYVTLRRIPDGVVGLQPSSTPGALCSAAWGVWALAAGNSLIVNAPPTQPLAVHWLYQKHVAPLLAESGATSGVLSVLCTSVHKTTSGWLENPGVDTIMFCGPTVTGRTLESEAVAADCKPVMELSGGDGVLVWDDADISAVGRVLTEAFYASGQLPASPRWVLAHPAIVERLIGELAGHVLHLRPGLPSDPSVVLSPGVNGSRFDRQLEQAATAGAKLLTGGRLMALDGTPNPAGPFAEPTLLWLRDMSAASTLDCLSGECAGPILTIIQLEGSDEETLLKKAISFLNSNHYGLRNSVWTADAARAEHIVARLRNGGIIKVNDTHLGCLPGMPTGGGSGLSGGVFGEATWPWMRCTRLQAVADATALGGAVPTFAAQPGAPA